MGQSKIEWCDKVWNPITGCSPISEGCEHCWAKRMANRLRGRYGYPQDEPFRVTFHPDRLTEPRNWKKTAKIFVCSMGDLFHDDVDFDSIDEIMQVIAETNHTFMMLTKRPLRMKRYFAYYEHNEAILPDNLWLGVSCENQARADERIPILLQIPAAVRFVSLEPMLGPISLQEPWKLIGGKKDYLKFPGAQCINWVIPGGETGPGARPLHPDWVRSVRDQCQAAGVPFFFKGWGEWAPQLVTIPRSTIPAAETPYIFKERGKKTAGRLLDGRTWEEYPK